MQAPSSGSRLKVLAAVPTIVPKREILEPDIARKGSALHKIVAATSKPDKHLEMLAAWQDKHRTTIELQRRILVLAEGKGLCSYNVS